MAPVSLPPGFRFHPTDEELVTYYLHSKIKGKSMELDIISEIDLYRYEPWDLPDKSFLPSKDMEWYFFSTRDRKYPNGSRTNRATKAGYWKATGKDRTVYSNKNPVGVKKTLVFYGGRAPHGVRTNWVMHEYRIVDSEPGSTLTLMDSYALCRVFKKMVQKTISIDKQVDDQEEDWQLCQIQSVFDHNIRDNGLFPPKDEKYREEEEVRFLSEFRSDASSSEITQGTSGDDFFLESTRMAYRIDEENSSTTGFFPHIYSASQCTKERTMMDYTRMEHQIPYPPLTTVNFSRMNTIDTMVLQEQENGEYITEEKYKNCWNQGNLEEIISVLCSSHANSNCQPSQCF